MNRFFKKIIKLFLILSALFVIGYAGYIVYDYIVQDITKRVRQEVTKGIGKGIVGALNPINWFRKKP